MIYNNVLMFNNILAIKPEYRDNHLSKIITSDFVLCSDMNTNDLMNQFCTLYASSLEGRMNAAKNILGIRKHPSRSNFIKG